MKAKSISKVLSSNDIGLTGGHQAGILVPKQEDILSFFPKLDNLQKNPRYLLTFIDDCNQRWEFSFIYYNNVFFGGTRNEYRLTRMTKYIRENNLKIGDQLILINGTDGIKRISFSRNGKQVSGKLRLSSEWKVIQL
jgi:hypothetical protein